MSAINQMYNEAIKLKEAGQLADGAAKLKEILVMEPNHVFSHSALAVILQKLGKEHYVEAVAHAKKVVELDPKDPFSYTQLSVICQRCGMIAEAEDALARSRMIHASH
jgi:Flp pilus assembly protein TadD